jgi:hypothetical protein
MNLLEKNVGGIDKVLRIGAGVLMVYFGFIDKSFITDELGSTLLGGFGIMFTLSGLLGMCPLYNVIGINTCKENN